MNTPTMSRVVTGRVGCPSTGVIRVSFRAQWGDGLRPCWRGLLQKTSGHMHRGELILAREGFETARLHRWAAWRKAASWGQARQIWWLTGNGDQLLSLHAAVHRGV